MRHLDAWQPIWRNMVWKLAIIVIQAVTVTLGAIGHQLTIPRGDHFRKKHIPTS